MNYMDAYISNGKIEKPWYPRRLSPFQVKRKIMRDAFLEGYNVKQIAGYFKMNVMYQVYDQCKKANTIVIMKHTLKIFLNAKRGKVI